MLLACVFCFIGAGVTYAYFTSTSSSTLTQSSFGTLSCVTSVDGGASFNSVNSVSLSSATDREVLLHSAQIKMQSTSENGYIRIAIGYMPSSANVDNVSVRNACVALNSEIEDIQLYSCASYGYEYINGYFYLVDNSGAPIEASADVVYNIFDSSSAVLAMPDIDKFNIAGLSIQGVELIIEAQCVQSANIPLLSAQSAIDLDSLITGANIFNDPIADYGKIVRYETLGGTKLTSTIITGSSANLSLPQVSGVNVTWYSGYDSGAYSGEVGVSQTTATIQESTTLYAQYATNGVMVFFEKGDAESGTLPTNALVTSGSSVIANSAMTKTAYTHTGWKNKYTDSTSGISVVGNNIQININSFTLGTAVTLVPVFTPISYTATFTTSQGVIDRNSAESYSVTYTIETNWNKDVNYQYPIVLLEDDSVYEFIGWKITAIDNASGTNRKVGEIITNINKGLFGVTAFSAVLAVKEASESTNKIDIASAIIGSISNYTYSGSYNTPIPSVTYNNELLVKDVDYTLGYSNHLNAGTAEIIITGIGDFTGSISRSFTIYPLAITSNQITVSSVATQEYTGDPIEPTPNVVYGTTTLTKDVDYTLNYVNNIDSKIATIIISGIGNFTQMRFETFQIGNLVNPTVVEAVASLVYNYALQDLVYVSNQEGTIYYSYDTPLNSSNYTLGAVNIPQQQNAGKYQIYYYIPESPAYQEVVGNLQVSIEQLSLATFNVSGMAVSYQYNESGVTPLPTVTHSAQSYILIKDQDYELSYTNNMSVTQTAQVTIAGKGNYTGTSNVLFTIVQKATSAPTNLTWNAGILSWSNVENESGYLITLYKNSVAQSTSYTTNADVCTYDFTSVLKNEVNNYHAIIVAKGVGNYCNSVASQQSEKQYSMLCSFNANSGSACNGVMYITGEVYGTLPTTTRTGYIFNGWYKESGFTNKVETSTTITNTANYTLYAKWTAITYTVVFNANGGTGSMNNMTFTYDQAQNLTANAFSKPTYTVTFNKNYISGTSSANSNATFKNWNTASGGTGTSYTNQQSVSNLSSTNGATINLYAQWNAYNSVTLPSTTSGYITYGVALYKPNNKWYTTSAMTTSVGNDGASYTPTGTTTLYAGWAEQAYIRGTLGNDNYTLTERASGSYIYMGFFPQFAYSTSQPSGTTKGSTHTHTNSSTTTTTYTNSSTGEKYELYNGTYYKYTPILWKIGSTSTKYSNGYYLLISEYIIGDSYCSASSGSSYTYYHNNLLKTYINSTIYSMAFTTSVQQNALKGVTDTSDSYAQLSGDKLFALSDSDVLNSSYGFSTSSDSSDTRKKFVTPFANAIGCYWETSYTAKSVNGATTYPGYWWLRTLLSLYDVWSVDIDGHIFYSSPTSYYPGAVPACTIAL